MDIAAVITQLISAAPIFEGRVAGAAEFAGVETTTSLVTPCAFVLPQGGNAGNNVNTTGLYQTVVEKIGIVVIMNNSLAAGGDRRGQATAQQLDTYMYAIHKAILRYPFMPNRTTGNGLEFDSYTILQFDRARTFVEYDYILETIITEQDGWMDNGVPLTDIIVNQTDPLHPNTVVDMNEIDVNFSNISAFGTATFGTGTFK